MANPIHRKSDVNSAGGAMVGPGQSFVYDQGLEVSVDGSGVAAHFPFVPPHIGPTTSSGSSFVFIQGTPVNFEGNSDSCGHPRTGGSSLTFISE